MVTRELWCVMFKGHIHTDIDQRLAVFRSRELARAWVRKNGIRGCVVFKLAKADLD